MVRVKGGLTTRRKHKKVLTLAKGYWMTRHKQFKKAKEAVLHAGEYAFVGRKLRKRNFRTLWIQRINAGVRTLNITYSSFISLLLKEKIQIDRKILAKLATDYPLVFEKLVGTLRSKPA